jgi:hypothetical protein
LSGIGIKIHEGLNMRRIAKFFTLLLAPMSACYAAPELPYADMIMPEKKASVELMIPFGGQRENRDYKPRLQLSFDARLPQSYRANQQSVHRGERFRSSKIGFTLASNPEIYLNGRHFAAAERRSNISTLGWVGIGAAVLITGGVLVLSDALNDSECCE